MISGSCFDQVFMIFHSIYRQRLVKYLQIYHEKQHKSYDFTITRDIFGMHEKTMELRGDLRSARNADPHSAVLLKYRDKSWK
jgi:hypothetical protein